MNQARTTLIRVLLWVLLGMSALGSINLLTRPSHPKPSASGLRESTALQDEAVAGFAAAFAQVWLTWPVHETPEAWQSQLGPFVPSDLLNSTFQQPVIQGKKGQQVESVFPVKITRLSLKNFVVDVYAETNLHPIIELSVPVTADAAGHMAVTDPPMVKPVPNAASIATTPTDTSAPDTVSNALRPVVTAFLQAYLSGRSSSDLTNFLAPGTSLQPLNGLLTWKSLTDLQVLGKGPYTVVATVTVEDPVAQVTLPQTYVMHMVLGDGKWFVSSLQP